MISLISNIHLRAWATVFVIVIVIGCGDGSDPVDLGLSGKSSRVELADNVHVLPSDGSLVVTAYGQTGVQFAGGALDYLNPGDHIIVAAPITDEARAKINHIGGFHTISEGTHLIPREYLPDSLKTPGNSDYSHFLFHIGRVGRRVIETGVLARNGAIAYTTPESEKIFGSVVHSVSHTVSHIAHSATHAVTHEATSAAHSVTNAATDVASAATKATSEVTSAATSLGNSIGDLTKIDKVFSTIETFGAKFKDVVKSAEIVMENTIKDPTSVVKNVINTAEFLVTGDAHAGFDDSGKFSLELKDYKVKKKSGEAAVSGTVSGTLTLRHHENAQINFHDYKFESLDFGVSADVDMDFELSEITGEGELPIAKYALTPVVVDAGVPVVIIREIDIFATLGATSEAKLTASGDSDVSITATMSGNGVPHVAPAISGNAHFGGLSTTASKIDVDLVTRVQIKLYDLAGPYVDLTLFKADLMQEGNTNVMSAKVSGAVGIGANLEEMGFDGGSVSKPLYEQQYSNFEVEMD